MRQMGLTGRLAGERPLGMSVAETASGEKTLDKWVFVVDKKLLAPVLRERARFIEQPEKTGKKGLEKG